MPDAGLEPSKWDNCGTRPGPAGRGGDSMPNTPIYSTIISDDHHDDHIYTHQQYTQRIRVSPGMIRDTQDVPIRVDSNGDSTQVRIVGNHYSGIWMDEAEEITEREPPIEDLGEFLLMKYNKRKAVPC